MEKQNVVEETVGFKSENAGYMVGLSNSNSTELAQDKIPQFDYKDFFSRPVKIASILWEETDPISILTSFKPWTLFFNDARIKAKIQNFAFLRCKLKVRFVINASPFYYGAMMASYHPCTTIKPNTIAASSGNEYLIPYSQRPHLWLYPQGNQGGDMELPFLLNRPFIKTWLTADFDEMGEFNMIPYVQLQSANGTTGTGVTITVFAWAEDLVLTGPTAGLPLAQAGDEYTGSVSKPSSFIANVASKLTSIPVIGPFALATKIGAGAVASIAHIFGFTNTPVLADVQPVQPRPLHNFADTTIGFPTDKLTLDPKNELGLSQHLIGLKDSEDPLAIPNIINRESYLCTIPWSTADAADTILFHANVEPTLCDVDNSTYPQVYSTPMSYVAAMFNQWRGDIVFRFHIIASQFHKGRIRIQWDPAGYTGQNIVTDSASYASTFNQIIDIGKDTNVEFRIPYCQSMPFLVLNQFGVCDFSTSHNPTFSYDQSKMNGTILVRAVTTLSAPLASSSIQILVSVRSANVEFANPSGYVSSSQKYSLLPVQGGYEYDDEAEEVSAGQPSIPADHLYLSVFGEQVVSLRPLCKRMALHTIMKGNYSDTWGYHFRFRLYRMAPQFGFQAHGLNAAKSLITPANTVNFNWNPISTISWITPCFVGQRGSVNFSVVMDSTAFTSNTTTSYRRNIVTARRMPHTSVTQINNTFYTVTTTTYQQIESSIFSSVAGQTVQLLQTNNGVEFQLPNMSQVYFQNTGVTNGNDFTTADQCNLDTVEIVAFSNGAFVNNLIFSGAGPDFNVVFFLNTPTVYTFSAVPTPA